MYTTRLYFEALTCEQNASVLLNVTLYSQQGKHCPVQVYAWAFKMKIIPVIHYIEI
jgi:hypothetical protein